MKECKHCLQTKEFSEFFKARDRNDGHSRLCKQCDRIRRESDRQKNIAGYKECANRYYKKNKDKIIDYHLTRKFGITLAQYNRMFQEQQGLCAICNMPETTFDKRTNSVRKLAVDHNHTTGNVRKLLCTACNQGIGNLKEDPRILLQALDYLNAHRSVTHG